SAHGCGIDHFDRLAPQFLCKETQGINLDLANDCRVVVHMRRRWWGWRRKNACRQGTVHAAAVGHTAIRGAASWMRRRLGTHGGLSFLRTVRWSLRFDRGTCGCSPAIL